MQETQKTHVTLIYDLEIKRVSRGCWGTCSCKISWKL